MKKFQHNTAAGYVHFVDDAESSKRSPIWLVYESRAIKNMRPRRAESKLPKPGTAGYPRRRERCSSI